MKNGAKSRQVEMDSDGRARGRATRDLPAPPLLPGERATDSIVEGKSECAVMEMRLLRRSLFFPGCRFRERDLLPRKRRRRAAAARGALSKAKGQKEGVKEEGTNNPMRVLGCE